jgi:cytochrome c oxidase subunit 4
VAMSERGSLKPMYLVWIWLLIITIVEVLLAYFHVPVTIMLIALLGMSFVKASMIVAWFMHLKFERVSLVLTLIPAAVMCMILMNVVWPDSIRLHMLGH